MTAAGVLRGTWVLVASGKGLLRMKRQMPPGLGPVFTPPRWLAIHSGPRLGLVAAAAMLSCFPRPLAALLTQGRMA